MFTSRLAVTALVCLTLLAPLAAMAIEEPRHTVIDTSGPFQIRQYEPALMAEVEVSGERSEAINKGFRVLANFIFGNNRVQQKIAMTAPVTQVAEPASTKIAMTAPVTQVPVTPGDGQAAGEQRWRVAFMMPSQYTMDTLPLPNDPRIKIGTMPGEKRVAIVFDGFSTQANLGKHREMLEQFVKERGLTPVGPYMVAFYNDPFTLPWNRRNEWWVPVAP